MQKKRVAIYFYLYLGFENINYILANLVLIVIKKVIQINLFAMKILSYIQCAKRSISQLCYCLIILNIFLTLVNPTAQKYLIIDYLSTNC